MISKLKDKLYILRSLPLTVPSLFGGRFSELLIWVLCLALALFGLRRFWLAQGLVENNVDESIYTYVGWVWGKNYWPYLQSWDHKGPIVYLTTLLRTALAGTEPEMIGLQHIVVGSVTAILVAGIAYRLWRGLCPALALALGILVWTQQSVQHGIMATPGSLIGLFSTGAILAAFVSAQTTSFRISAVLSSLMGLTSGLAVCTKPNAIGGLIIGLIAIYWLSEHRTRRERLFLTFLAGLGIAVPIVAIVILFYYASALNALVDCYIVFNSIYGRQMFEQHGILTLAFRAIKTLADGGILPLLLSIYALAVTVIAMTPMRFINTKHDIINHKRNLILPLWLSFELCLFISNGGWSYHMFPILPPIVLSATWLLIGVSRLSPRPIFIGRAASLFIFILLVIPLMLSIVRMHPPTGKYVLRMNKEWRQIVNAVAEATLPNDKVLVLTWDATFIMNFIQRQSVTKYIHTVPLITHGYATDKHWVELLGEIEGNPPKVILLGTFSQNMPGDVSTALTWSLRWFFRYPYDSTPYPHKEKFKSFISSHYYLDQCFSEGFFSMCMLRRLD